MLFILIISILAFNLEISFSACTKTLPMKSILVSYSGIISNKPPDSYCYFHDLITGNFTSSEDEENCWESFDGINSFPVSYACKKQSLCHELDCMPNPKNPEKCYISFPKTATYFEASRKCDELGGNCLICVIRT